MVDAGPFQLNAADFERLQAQVTEILRDSRALAVEQYKHHEKLGVPGVPDATIEGRSAFSQIVQCLVNAAPDCGIAPFDIIDGFAHDLAVYLAQQTYEGGQSGLKLLRMQMGGYFDRSYAAFNQKPERLDG